METEVSELKFVHVLILLLLLYLTGAHTNIVRNPNIIIRAGHRRACIFQYDIRPRQRFSRARTTVTRRENRKVPS